MPLPVLLVTLVLVFPLAAGAAPGPAGSVYGIADRPVPPRGWWSSCTYGDGRRAALVAHCIDCDASHGDIFLERYDQDGDRIGKRVVVNEAPALQVNFRLSCSEQGHVVAQWVQDGCFVHRVFDATGKAAGSAVATTEPDCRTRATLDVDDDGRTVAAWPLAEPSQGTHIFARLFDASGAPLGAAVQVSEGTPGWRVQPKVALDPEGAAMIAWLGAGEFTYSAMPVLARALDASGKTRGAPFRVDTFEYGAALDPVVVSTGEGEFEVAWTSALEGGRVARRVLLKKGDADMSAGVAAAGTDGLPSFGAARFVDSRVSSDGVVLATRLHAGKGKDWLVSGEHMTRWRSDDDSRSWDGPLQGEPELGRQVVASNGAGVTLALRLDVTGGGLHAARSTDDGMSFGASTLVSASPRDCLNPCWTGAASAAGTAAGTWIAAWTLQVPDETGNADLVAVSRSHDGGITWSPASVIAEDRGLGRRGFELATNGKGVWVLLMADTDVVALRSSDDGASWNSPQVVAADVTCENCQAAFRHLRLALASDGSRFVAVFGAPRYRSDLYGHDGDLFVLRSTDGVSWSAPAALVADAHDDGSPDFAPALATDRAGRWLAMWITHRPAGGGDALDADVVVSMSDNGGVSWTAPALIDPRMAADQAGESDVQLAAKTNGRWLAVWQQRPFGRTIAGVEDRLLVSAAEAACGNAIVEIGEHCDDGGTASDDGCDADCTMSGCGNGIVNSGEECDDANDRNDDACVSTCTQPRCGDGVVSAGESCDDGNSAENDGCSSTCGQAYCGDGYVNPGFEECDEGPRSTQRCTPQCKLARCGDGYLAPRAEACDDGNAIDDDECPNDCSKFTCGDGVTAIGFEECDPQDPMYEGACTTDCLLVGLCGDANADDNVTAADARIILSSAVGLPADCPKRACDMDGNGAVTVPDAAMDLRKAVGLTVGDRCSIGTGTIVFWMQETRPLAALQLEIEYGSTGGDFLGTNGDVACRSLVAQGDVISAFNDNEEARMLGVGLVSLAEFSGIVDLFQCEFEMPEERDGVRFLVRVVDVSDANFEPLDPPPLLGYRVE
ncbi:MAG TPA: DUF4215 domain-containing protein [Candidatus Binatia bacterium]|nr:DUF4215 domain-containing protein [Candidatus Binatia bacterium]